jgi:hypothetical protein
MDCIGWDLLLSAFGKYSDGGTLILMVLSLKIPISINGNYTGEPLMKKILAGAGAVLAVTMLTFSGSANAACVWNGYSWDCRSPQIYYQPDSYQYGPQPSYGYGYGQSQPAYYGQYQQWSPMRYPGPKAGGGGN